MAGGLGSAVHLAQVLITEKLKHGHVAVDATAGRGNDTLFLARLVGPTGIVYAFDIQKAALARTESLLKRQMPSARVELICDGHEKMLDYVPSMIDAVMYNLGYLPGGDQSITTGPKTTIASVNAALSLLKKGGRISLVIYTGHPGGRQEYAAVEQYVSMLDSLQYRVIKINFLNRAANAPVLIMIEKGGVYSESGTAAQNS